MRRSSPGFLRRSRTSFQKTASARRGAEAHAALPLARADQLEVHLLERPRCAGTACAPARPRRTRQRHHVGRLLRRRASITRSTAALAPARWARRAARPAPAGSARASPSTRISSACPARRSSRSGATASSRPLITATRAHSRSTSARLCEHSTMRAPLGGQLRHRVAHGARGLGVEPAGGLVEEEHLRVVHQRADDRQLLPHALAEAAAPARPRARPARSAAGSARVRSATPSASSQLVELDEEAQVLPRGEPVVEPGLLGEQAHRARAAPRRRRPARVAAHRGLPREGGAARSASAPWWSSPRRWGRAGRRPRPG